MFSDKFVTSEKFLGSGMKWETSEPGSPKAVNSCEISFKRNYQGDKEFNQKSNFTD